MQNREKQFIFIIERKKEQKYKNTKIFVPKHALPYYIIYNVVRIGKDIREEKKT